MQQFLHMRNHGRALVHVGVYMDIILDTRFSLLL
jgi:hypothetical protein